MFKVLPCWFLSSKQLSGAFNCWDFYFDQNASTALKGSDVCLGEQCDSELDGDGKKGLTFPLRASHIMHRHCRRDSSLRCTASFSSPSLPSIAPLHQLPVSAARLFFSGNIFCLFPPSLEPSQNTSRNINTEQMLIFFSPRF